MDDSLDRTFKILILGGTRNARDLAIRLAGRDAQTSPKLEVITSLAGRTQEPDRTFGETRVGGFGGIEGLAKYLDEEKFDLLVDSTHPFATQISQHALQASNLAQVPLLVLNRPQWQKQSGDNWIDCDSLEEAADKLPTGSVAFLALGHQYLDRFSGRDDVSFIARMVDEPKTAIPLKNHQLVIAKPSHVAAEEFELFKRHAVTHLVCRNSGGRLVYAKIETARDLKLPVLMLKRPPRPEGKSFSSVADLASEIIRLCAG